MEDSVKLIKHINKNKYLSKESMLKLGDAFNRIRDFVLFLKDDVIESENVYCFLEIETIASENVYFCYGDNRVG